MKKKILLLLSAFPCAVLMAGCNGGAGNSSANPSRTARTESLVIPTRFKKMIVACLEEFRRHITLCHVKGHAMRVYDSAKSMYAGIASTAATAFRLGLVSIDA